MKIEELFEAKKKTGRPPKIKPRPKGKVLWYTDQQMWAYDVNARFPVMTRQAGDDIVLVDQNEKFVYGVWHVKDGKGCTYDKPRLLHTAIHPRHKLKQIAFNDALQDTQDE